MITLTREEAQQVLDLMTRYRTETPLGHQPHMISHKADEAIETLRARLSAPEPSIVEDAIVYGTGITMGGKRIAPDSIYKEPDPEPVAGYRWEEGRTPPSVTFTAPPQPEPPCKTGSQCIGGKCPQCVVGEPAGWIYEDDEGRMMFSQMPTSGLFWEPVYREKNNKGIE
jgi:hypothetical protein